MRSVRKSINENKKLCDYIVWRGFFIKRDTRPWVRGLVYGKTHIDFSRIRRNIINRENS